MWVIKAHAAAQRVPLSRVPLSLAASGRPLELQEVMTRGSWSKIPLKDPGSNAGGGYGQPRGPGGLPGLRVGGGGARLKKLTLADSKQVLTPPQAHEGHLGAEEAPGGSRFLLALLLTRGS